MSLVDCPAHANHNPMLLDGLTCDGLEPRALDPERDGVSPAALFPEEGDCFGEEMDAEPFLNGDFTSSAEDAADGRTSRHDAQEMFVGLGWALALHVSLVLAAFLLPLVAPLPVESQFITLNLVEAPGGGGGVGSRGAPTGPEGAEAESSSSVAACIPVPDRVASLLSAPEPKEVPPIEEPVPFSLAPAPPEKPVPKEPPSQPKVCKPPKKQVVVENRNPARDADVSTRTGDISAPASPEAAVQGNGCAASPVQGPGNGAPGVGEGRGAGQGAGGGAGSSSGVGGVRGEFTLRQVEHPPVVLHKVDPHFPETARRMGVTGRVVVKFLVKSDGRVDRASILEAFPSGHFERSVLDALNQWKFKPGIYKGKAVATWVVQPINFKLAR